MNQTDQKSQKSKPFCTVSTGVTDSVQNARFHVYCDHCHERLFLAELIDRCGIIILTGRKHGYVGSVCPHCLKTVLTKTGHDAIDELRCGLQFPNQNQPSEGIGAWYHSFPYSIRRDICDLNIVDRFFKPLTPKNTKLESWELAHLSNLSTGVPEGVLCSYSFGDSAIGPAITAWWFKEEDVDHFLSIENRDHVRVFPRYIAYNQSLAAIEQFCWKYRLKKHYVDDLALFFPGRKPKTDFLNNSYHKQIKRRDFLELLSHEQVTQHLRTDIKSARCFARELDNDFVSIIADTFIKDYLALVQKNSFSVDAVYNLQAENIEKLCAPERHAVMSSINDTIPLKECVPSIETYKTLRPTIIPPLSRLFRLGSRLFRKPRTRVSNQLVQDNHRCLNVQLSLEESCLAEIGEIARQFVDANHKKPLDIESFAKTSNAKDSVPEALPALEKRVTELKKIVTKNQQLMDLKWKSAEIARFDTDILILGETGTGKELFARAIHQASGRSGDFVPLNCAGVPKDSFEAQLFGYGNGGSAEEFIERHGALEQADRGTLFLDEVAELPLELQGQILRAVEYREITPVGAKKSKKMDVKLIFATNKDIRKEAEKGAFRKDLFFRIFSPCIAIPPLRARPDDIPLLTDHFLNLSNQKFNKQVNSITPSVIDKMTSHTWEGNVRELRKIIETAVMNASATTITENDISGLSGVQNAICAEGAKGQRSTDSTSLAESIKDADPETERHSNVFVRKGDTWLIKYCNQTTTVRDFEKIRYIAYLLKHANEEVNNCDLVAAVKKCDLEPASVESNMEDSSLDTDLTREEIQRLRKIGWEVWNEMKEADDKDDLARKAEAAKKWDFYRKHMLNKHGIRVALSDKQEIVFKTMRRPGPEAEKARLTVRNQIENGFKEIERELPDLGAHLRQNIHRTSWYAVYQPPPDSSIQWYVIE